MATPNPARPLARFLEQTLSAALTPFHPRIALLEPHHKRPSHPWMSGATVSLYATCCLELYNHLAEHASYRHCENPTCRRVFVRQTGRAEAGQHHRYRERKRRNQE